MNAESEIINMGFQISIEIFTSKNMNFRTENNFLGKLISVYLEKKAIQSTFKNQNIKNALKTQKSKK